MLAILKYRFGYVEPGHGYKHLISEDVKDICTTFTRAKKRFCCGLPKLIIKGSVHIHQMWKRVRSIQGMINIDRG